MILMCVDLANVTMSNASSRKRTAAQDQDSTENNQSIPQNDIYRARQQKRVHLTTTS